MNLMTSFGAALVGMGAFSTLYWFLHTKTRRGRSAKTNAFAEQDQRLGPAFFTFGVGALMIGLLLILVARVA
jgi:hypothetical protein